MYKQGNIIGGIRKISQDNNNIIENQNSGNNFREYYSNK